MTRPLSIAVLALAVAGCADHTAEHLAALQGFVGHDEAEVVRAFGVPTRTFETGGRRFLAYRESRATVLPGGPVGFGPWGYGPELGFGYQEFPPEIIQQVCETTFEVASGRVLAATLRGNACG